MVPASCSELARVSSLSSLCMPLKVMGDSCSVGSSPCSSSLPDWQLASSGSSAMGPTILLSLAAFFCQRAVRLLRPFLGRNCSVCVIAIFFFSDVPALQEPFRLLRFEARPLTRVHYIYIIKGSPPGSRTPVSLKRGLEVMSQRQP